MTQPRSDTDAAARAAMLCAAAMIAQQVAAKATRDAMFLSSFGVEALPAMLVVSALVSIGFVFATTRVMAAVSIGRLVPIAFAVSGALLVGEWALARSAAPVAAVAVYLHVASFGSVLVSAFWSLASERFDPHTAKQRISRIAGAATLGGLLGGVAAERVAALLGVASMLPLLAVLHFACAFWVRRIRPTEEPARGGDATGAAEMAPALRLVSASPYLRSLAGLVLLGSVAGALVDYLFKNQAVAEFGSGVPLMRFFAAFYAGTGLLAFVVQISLGRISLERLGLARTVATLPLAVLAGGFSSLLAPGLISAAGMRGAESVARGSLYRLGYELLFAPLGQRQRRATKTLLDVGLDRLGDALGGGLVRLALFASPQAGLTVMSAMVLIVGAASFWIVRGLGRGYHEALKRSMLERAEAVGAASVPVPVLGAADTLDTGLFLLTLGMDSPAQARRQTQPAPKPPPGGVHRSGDPLVERLQALRSGDGSAVRRALTGGPLESLLVPQVISLLAWDEVCDDAVRALATIAPRIVGQLSDSLLDPAEPFAIRRRIPRVLAQARTQPALEALQRGLDDKRFEVRFGCGRALARALAADPQLRIPEAQAYAVVLREAAADRTVWESHRLLDSAEEPDAPSDLDDFVRSRGSRSLEHVFRVLSFALPGEPLRVAFQGLHTADEMLRGTALEYLESVLPAAVRESLWPFLDEGERSRSRPTRSREEVLEALMHSHSSIELKLAALRSKPREGQG